MSSNTDPVEGNEESIEGPDIHPVILQAAEEETPVENAREPFDLSDLDIGTDDLSSLYRPTRPRAKKPVEEAVVADEQEDQTAAAVIDAIEQIAAREAALKAEVETQKNNHLRAVADLHNYRRRAEEELKRVRAGANERLIKEILPLVDDFDLAIGAATQTESYEQLISGVEAIFRKFIDVLAKEGVEAVPAVGETFNPDIHDAVMLDEESDAPDETVTAQLRAGYTLHGRLIRPALVKVAKAKS